MKYLILILILGACTTPQYDLVNDKGETYTCGGSIQGSLAGGVIGYQIQKSNNEKCVEIWEARGYKVTKITEK